MGIPNLRPASSALLRSFPSSCILINDFHLHLILQHLYSLYFELLVLISSLDDQFPEGCANCCPMFSRHFFTVLVTAWFLKMCKERFTESFLLSIKLKVDNLNKQLYVPPVKRGIQDSYRHTGLMASLTKPVRCQGKWSSVVLTALGKEPHPCFHSRLLPVGSPCSSERFPLQKPYNITMHNNLSLLFMAFLQSPYF